MIIQFSHPGGELEFKKRSTYRGKHYQFDNPFKNGIRYWNKFPDHKRKFIAHPGWYVNPRLNEPVIEKSELFFWGEWEPQSRFEIINKVSAQAPSSIHKPYLELENVGTHNTDPFVFSKHFYYTNCKQKPTRGRKNMLKLKQDTIILFGSFINEEFVLDTVFVVNKSESFKEYKEHRDRYPESLCLSTLNLRGGLEDINVLYEGKMYNEDINYKENITQLFSFVPCKIASADNFFERPILDKDLYQLHKPIRGKILKEVNVLPKEEFWQILIEDMTSKGFLLGIQLEDVPFS